MKRAIFGRMMAVALAAVLLLGATLLWAFYDTTTDVLDDSVEREARIAALGMNQAADPQAFLESFVPGTRVTWIAQDGSVLFDSEAARKCRRRFLRARAAARGFPIRGESARTILPCGSPMARLCAFRKRTKPRWGACTGCCGSSRCCSEL